MQSFCSGCRLRHRGSMMTLINCIQPASYTGPVISSIEHGTYSESTLSGGISEPGRVRKRSPVRIIMEDDLEKERLAHMKHVGKAAKPNPKKVKRLPKTAVEILEDDILSLYDKARKGLKINKRSRKAQEDLQACVDEMRRLFIFSKHVPHPPVALVKTAIKKVAELCIYSRMGPWFSRQYERFFEELAEMCVGRVQEFDAQGCAVVIWSYGKVAEYTNFQKRSDSNVRELVIRLIPRTVRHVGDVDFGILAMALHGLANLRFEVNRDLFHSAMLRVTNEMSSLSRKSFACILWASARIGFYDNVGFTSKAIARLDRELKSFSTDELCMLIWGAAKYDSQGSLPVLMRLNNMVEDRLEEFTPLGICRFLEACKFARFDPGEEKVLSLFCQFSRLSQWFTPRILAESLPVLAHYEVISEDFKQLVFTKFLCQDSFLKSQDVANMLGAFAISGQLDAVSMRVAQDAISHALDSDQVHSSATGQAFHALFPRDACCQLYKVILSSDLGLIKIPSGEKFFSRRIRSVCSEAWILNEKQQTQRTIVEDISSVLQKKEWKFEPNYYLDRANIQIDILTHRRNDGKRFAVCVVTSEDTFTNSARISPDLIWRESVIKHAGVQPIRIFENAWNNLSTVYDKSLYIDNRL